MRALLIITLSSLLPLPYAQSAIFITEVMSDSSHPGGTSNGDWFELTNSGALAVNITGWSWDDDSNTPGTAGFGGLTTINPGQSILVVRETTGQEASWASDWGVTGATLVNLGAGSGIPDFSVSGDTLYIYDNTNTQVTTVTFGSSTQGFSFEWDGLGNSLGLSANGENGAFRASSDGASGTGVDIGSPGVAQIPEPSRLLLLAAGTLAATLRRRR